MPALLEVENLSVHYGNVTANKDLSITVEPGQIVGLIGPNGAGKTTLIDAVTGYTPYVGDVRFEGTSMNGLPPHKRFELGLHRTFQSLELFEDLTVRENLILTTSRPSRWSLVRDLVWPRRIALSEDAINLADQLGLTHDLDEMPEELSHGRRKLVSIARSALGNPRLLLLDEPAAGLSSMDSAGLGTDLTAMRDRTGVSIVIIDHDMNLVMSMCDQVYVLDFGSLIAQGPPSQIRTNPIVLAAYLGTQDERLVAEIEADMVGVETDG